MPEAKVIRATHPDDLTESKEKLACFLSGWPEGPHLYREKYGSIATPKTHSHPPIGFAECDAWLLCMAKALAEQSYADSFKDYMLRQLFVPTERSRTQD